MIRCSACGHFISFDDIDAGRVSTEYTPDSAFTRERCDVLCPVCTNLAKALPRIKTTRHYSDEWTATREEWDLGEPLGTGNTEAEAIADLLEREKENWPHEREDA